MDKLFIVFEYDDTFSGVGDSIVASPDGSYVLIADLVDFWRMHGKKWKHNDAYPAPVKQRVFQMIDEET